MAVATGHAFDACDIDGPEGHVSLVTEMQESDPPIWGPTTITGGGGWHVFIKAGTSPNRASFVPHVDWRGPGGYIVLPPSRHPSGRRYEWYSPDDELVGVDAPIQPAPAWLLDLLARRPEPAVCPVAGRPAPTGHTAYAQRALESEVGKVTLAPIGERNDTLNRAAFSLGQLVAGGVLDVDDVIDSLLVAASRCGLPTSEARASIASGLRAGSAQPRAVA